MKTFLDQCEPGVSFFGPNVPRAVVEEIMADLKALYLRHGGKDLQFTIEPSGDGLKASWVPIRE